MAFSKIQLNSSTWTLIGNNVTSITFQNICSFPIYINVTTTNTPPVDTIGLAYDIYDRELKIAPSILKIGGGTYVWAKLSSGASGQMIVEI